MIKNHLKLKNLYFSFGPQEHKSYWLGLALTGISRHLHKKSPSELDKKGKLFNTMFSILTETKLFVSDANMQPFGLFGELAKSKTLSVHCTKITIQRTQR